ncbi:hypothetical protein [Chromohalobacter sp. HP20-39]|uniref:hypothetical protein n=1 Tax=Chromohalobacter sp. HP20-39 TaxID=3079306 RepID=UPI00294B2516|nr:hypothetical protein [Chromohalobacter sp. HP20-39]MDV6318795.1 hypothetical protein [Chromohalobacter sp. HP20-39]
MRILMNTNEASREMLGEVIEFLVETIGGSAPSSAAVVGPVAHSDSQSYLICQFQDAHGAPLEAGYITVLDPLKRVEDVKQTFTL